MKRVIRGTLTLPFFFFFYHVLTNLHVSSLPWIFFERSPLHAYVYFIDIFNFLIRSDSSLFIYFWSLKFYLLHALVVWRISLGFRYVFFNTYIEILWCFWMFLEIIIFTIFKRILEFWIEVSVLGDIVLYLYKNLTKARVDIIRTW